MTAKWLLEKPSSPSIFDDEFDSDVIDPKWTLTGANPYVHQDYLDPHASFNSGNELQSLNRQRRSWWMFQPVAAGGSNRGVVQASVTLPTDCFIYLRGSINTRFGSAIDSDGEIAIRFADSSLSNYVLVMMDSFGGITGAIFSRNTASVFANIGVLRNYFSEAYPIEFLGIQKIGTTYHGWVAPCSGNWVWMGSYTHPNALTDLRITLGNSSNLAPGNLIVGIDFIRVVSGRKLP